MSKNLNFRFRTISVAMVIVILISSSFASCNENKEPSDTSVIVFTDALGQEVRIDKRPERVAALLGSFADIWMLAGGELCATADDAWSDFGLDLYNVVNIGGAHSPSIELLLSSDPDFVLASASTASNVKMKDTLDAAGITVAYFDIDNFEDYLQMLDICTNITGRKDLYEQNGLNIQAQIESIKEKYQNENIPDNEHTVLLLRVATGKIKAKGSQGTILGEMLASMGCINIADSDTDLLENLSIESIIHQNPYHIFAVAMGTDNEAAKASLDSMIKENPAWSTLEAVQEGRVHMMDKKLFNLKPNARWGEAYRKLYETLTEK